MSLLPTPDVPRLSAVAVGEVKTTSRNKPITMYCASITGGPLEEYVVKLYGDHWLRKRGLAREVIGSLLAHVFGLSVPQVALIDIGKNFYKSTPDVVLQRRLQNSPGLNSGSKYFGSGFLNPTIPVLVPREHLELAVEIFAFDMLVQNADRRNDKPNIFQTANGFTVYDHELAFPYAQPEMFPMHMEPWELSKSINKESNHIFYKGLRKRSDIDFGPFIDKLAKLSAPILNSIYAVIPDEWRDQRLEEDMNNITTYLLKAKDNVAKFKRGLMEALA